MNLLNESIDSKFLIRKWNIVNDQSNVHYDTASVIIYNTEVVKSNLWDYNDTYISLMDHNTVVRAPGFQIALKNCAPFTKWIAKIDGTKTYYIEHLDLLKLNWNLDRRTTVFYLCLVLLMMIIMMLILIILFLLLKI